MGSIEVYDVKQQRWVPYIADPEKWYQHFKDLSEGYVTPDHKGRYVVGSGRKNREKERPVVQLVSPVAQAIEMAKSELEGSKNKSDGETFDIREQRKSKKKTKPIDWSTFKY